MYIASTRSSEGQPGHLGGGGGQGTHQEGQALADVGFRAVILGRSDISVRNPVRYYSLNTLDQALLASLSVLEMKMH